LPPWPIREAYFAYKHLLPELQAVSQRFYELAEFIVDELPNSAERTVALRKLLEAKDAAVRAAEKVRAAENLRAWDAHRHQNEG